MKRILALAFCLALVAPSALGCLWDSETVEMERQRFPSAFELITGQFARHSRAFYEWRIRDRLAKLEARPTDPALYDDLAVAYDKTGRHAEAIETMRRKEKIAPRRYETYANLGTFYFHSGRLKEGLPYIDKAIAINPNAHFGREVYQRYLVEYVMWRSGGGPITLPLRPLTDDGKMHLRGGFEGFLFARLRGSSPDDYDTTPKLGPEGVAKISPEEQQAAIKGILGMMRFGDFRSPVLLEALGDLLASTTGRWDSAGRLDVAGDAKQLAAMAYLKAADAETSPQAGARYRELAEHALSGRLDSGFMNASSAQIDVVEKALREGVAQGNALGAAADADEAEWIASGSDPEAAFAAKYYDGPKVAALPEAPAPEARPSSLWVAISHPAVQAGALAFAALLFAGVVMALRRTRPAASPSPPEG